MGTLWLQAVWLADPDTGTIVGEDGTILRTTDGGEIWVSQTSGTSKHLLDVFFSNAETGTAVGNGGTILQTDNGGETWVPRTSHTDESLWSVIFVDENNGTIVGDNGCILGTDDGGATWTLQETCTDNDLFCVSFAGPETGMIVGQNGTILRTTTGGGVAVMLAGYAASWRGDHAEITWSVRRDVAESPLSFDFYRSDDGGGRFVRLARPDITAQGADYTLRDRTAQPGSRYIYRVVISEDGREAASFEVELETPALLFSLEQNHPNPFNPSTTLRYALPARSHVRIGVYDVAGREVAVIEDEVMEKGTHEARWDGSDDAGRALGAGVYFARLETGLGTRYSKMTLVK